MKEGTEEAYLVLVQDVCVELLVLPFIALGLFDKVSHVEVG